MKIKDLNGCSIEITNLDEAISITEQYKEYQHEDKKFSDFDKTKKVYWTDMFNKLQELKKQLINPQKS